VNEKRIEVVPFGGRWAIKRQGTGRVISVHRSRGDAMDVARQIVRNRRSDLLTWQEPEAAPE